jgi:transcriptional regulator with XRE-family HTH domain
MTFARAGYRELGAELRKRREAAGLTCAELATHTGWSPAKVSRIEIGWHEISVVDLVYFVGMCGVYRAQAMDLIAMCRDAERKLGYWLSPHEQWLEDSLSSLIYHEATARSSVVYQPQLVHGLLQTTDYARQNRG